MKTVMQTIAIATILVATFSCMKENESSTPPNTTSHTITSTSSGSIRDNEELLGFGSPVGNWVLYYDWGCTGSYNSTSMTVNADGTWTDGVYTGTWVDGKGIFMFNFNAPSRTTYSGTERIKRVVGIMSTFGTPNTVTHPGCFYMERVKSAASFKPYNVPGMPNIMGAKASK